MTVLVTDVGLDKITNAIQGEKVNITTYQLSSSSTMNKEQTTLDEVFHESSINGLGVDDKVVTTDIIVEEVEGKLATIGLLDGEGDLIAIAKHEVVITKGMTLEISVHLTLENADNVTLQTTEREVYASIGSVSAINNALGELETDILQIDERLQGIEQVDNSEGEGTTIGVKNLAEKTGSLSLGTSNKAYEKHGVAIGRANLAYAEDSVAIGASSKAIGEQSYAIGYLASADGDQSVAIGRSAKATSEESFSFGRSTETKGKESVAIGTQAKTLADQAISIGNETSVVAIGGVAIGTKASVGVGGNGATSIGDNTTATGRRSLATGYFTESSGDVSISGGQRTKAEGDYSVALGMSSVAEGNHSVVIGLDNQVVGDHAVVIGKDVITNADHSHAEGVGLRTMTQHTHLIGRYNEIKGTIANAVPTEDSDVWAVGNGASATERNTVARIQNDGQMFIDGRYRSKGADYAEMFEWFDGNEEDEDRVGLAVTVESGKVRLASEGDEVIGIISATPSIVGNDPDKWCRKYKMDEYGRVIYKDGKPVICELYDPEAEYTPRSKRKEWAMVGLLGQLLAKDDGTCEVGGRAAPSTDGIMTNSESGYIVLGREGDSIVRVLVR